MRRRSSTDPLFLKALAALVALGLLLALAAATLMTVGTLGRNPVRLLVAAVATVALALALVRLLQEARRRSDPNRLDPASELTTLTFPPTSRMTEGVMRGRSAPARAVKN